MITEFGQFIGGFRDTHLGRQAWAVFGATALGAHGEPITEPLVGVRGRSPLKLNVFLSIECPK